MTSYLPEFLSIAVAHALAMASPGPDFAIVLKQSLAHGRRPAVWTAIGIGSGLSVHITYCLLGLGVVLKNSATALLIFKYLGAAYLAYIGVQALRAKPRTGELEVTARADAPAARAAWTTGFLVNLLNPKAALSLLALFVLRVSPQTPKLIQVGYGVWMTVVTMAWFSFVAVVFTQPEVRRKFLRSGHWIDRALGVVLLGFALSLVLASVS
ncbi:MAG: rhtC [Lacunisphaera sp.]|nr:rhtC [Lacunisphaera sp.]MDB6165254.1 rhtC [Lacunisphaera sp.]